MSMPEASVDENGSPVFFEDNVGRTGKFLYIETVSESFGEQEFAHKEFGFGILASYALHAPAPLLGIHSVCHIVKVCKNWEIFCKFVRTQFKAYEILLPFSAVYMVGEYHSQV